MEFGAKISGLRFHSGCIGAYFALLWLLGLDFHTHHEGFDFGRRVRHPAEATDIECAQASGGLCQQAHDLAPGENSSKNSLFILFFYFYPHSCRLGVSVVCTLQEVRSVGFGVTAIFVKLENPIGLDFASNVCFRITL